MYIDYDVINKINKLNNKRIENAKKRFIGKKFGSLTVLDIGPIQKGVRYYLCKCECGEKELVKSNHLTHGNKIKCIKCNGRIKMSDHIGEEFGKLKIIDLAYYNNGDKRHGHVKCQCECGNTKIIKYQNIYQGLTKSCGQCRKRKRHNKCNEDCENCQYEDCILEYRDL